MSRVDRAAKNQDRIRRALQRLSNDPSGSLDIVDSLRAGFFSGGGATGSDLSVAVADLCSAVFLYTSQSSFDDSDVKSRAWIGV